MLHWRLDSIAFGEMTAVRFRFPHTDGATTVPSARGVDNQVKSTLGTVTRQVSASLLRKMTAYFWRRLRIFPQKIHPPQARNGKNAAETLSFAA